jgi:hypothetical protein
MDVQGYKLLIMCMIMRKLTAAVTVHEELYK